GGTTSGLHVEVQVELVRMRAQANRVGFLLALVVDPSLDDVRSEDLALEEEVVILFEVPQGFVEAARSVRDLGEFFGRQIVNVLIERLTWIDLVLDAVDGGHQDRREGQVWVAARVGTAELEALGLRVLAEHRDAQTGRAVAG